MKFLDLMNVVVKAVVNFLACHLYQIGDRWALFLFILFTYIAFLLLVQQN